MHGDLEVANPGEKPGGPVPPLFLDETEARSAEKFFWSFQPFVLRHLEIAPVSNTKKLYTVL